MASLGYQKNKENMTFLSKILFTKQRKAPMKLGDKRWLHRFNEIIEKHLKTVPLKNELLAEELKISERQLSRKVKELSKLSPQKYLRKYRLHQAMKLLKTGKYRTVKETSFAVGFLKVSYFISQFEKEFGKKPLKILQESGWR